jgi:hypothetical protein
MPLPFALVGFPIQLNAPSVRDAQVVRGWALEAEPGARLCEHIGQRQVKATATVNQGRVPLKEFAVTAPANAKRESVATTQGLQEMLRWKASSSMPAPRQELNMGGNW